VQGLSSRVDVVTSRVDGLTVEVRTGFDCVERRLGNIENRIEEGEERISIIEARP